MEPITLLPQRFMSVTFICQVVTRSADLDLRNGSHGFKQINERSINKLIYGPDMF